MSETFSISSNAVLSQYVNGLKPSNNLINSNKSKTQSNFLNKKVEDKSTQKKSNGASYADKIILAKKGQAGYMREFDLDNDGKVSLTEFNEYCEKNGIDGKDKLRLLTVIQSANSDEKVAEENLNDDEKSSEKSENNAVYAKKGDEKYDEAMDENSNGEVTYAEYFKYMQEKRENSEKSDNSTSNKNTQLGDEQEEYVSDNLEPEVQSTVEYDG